MLWPVRCNSDAQCRTVRRAADHTPFQSCIGTKIHPRLCRSRTQDNQPTHKAITCSPQCRKNCSKRAAHFVSPLSKISQAKAQRKLQKRFLSKQRKSLGILKIPRLFRSWRGREDLNSQAGVKCCKCVKRNPCIFKAFRVLA